MRFRTKTILGVALIEVTMLVVLVWSALSALRGSNEAELTRRVQLGGRLLAAAAKDALISQDLATLDSLAREAMASGQIDFVRIVDTSGVVLAQGGSAALLGRVFRVDERVDEVRDGVFDWAAPVVSGGMRHGVVQLGVSTDPLKVLLASARRWAAGIATLEIALVALFSWMLGSYLTRQLGALRKASEHFVAGNFGHRVAVRGADELAETAVALNRMAQQLGDSLERTRTESAKCAAAQLEAEKSSKLLREAVSSIAQGFTIYDEEDRLVHCNEAYLSFYETSRDLIVPGNTFEQIVRRGAERGQYSEAIDNVDGWVKRRVAQHQNANGEVIEQGLADGRWLLIVEYRTPSGYVVGNRIDITERKRMEQALAASEQRWELAVSGANDGIWDWNPQNGQVYYSERWKSMLGYSGDEIGTDLQAWTSRIHPDDQARTASDMQRHLRGETAFYECEYRLRCKNGDYKWVLDRGRMLADSHGQPLRMAGSHSDITERRAAQAGVREHAEQLQAIFALSPDGFVSFDADRRVSYVSPALTRLTALTPGQMIGLGETEFSQRLAGVCIPEASFHGLTVMRAGGEQRQVIELADASQRVLEVGLRESQGRSVSQILYLRDITHETEVDRLKSEFLSTAAHELRTPMASIFGFTEVLLTQELDEASRREFLTIIHRQSELMASILNELLDLARIEARRGKDFVFGRTHAQALVADVVQAFKPPSERPVPTLIMPATPLNIRADPQKARQAILNVISNAYKYSPSGGVVTVTATLVTDVVPMVRLCVSDHGIGMTPEQCSRVCERFYRADASGKVLGTGLGMSIVKEILDLHQGRVQIDSHLGQGTEVSLLFPLWLD